MPRTFSTEVEEQLLNEVRQRLASGEGRPAELSRALYASAPVGASFESYDRLVSRVLRRLRSNGEVSYCKQARSWRATPLGLDAAKARCQLHARDPRTADL